MLPIVGTILTKSIVSRSCRTLGITIGAGVPISQSLETIAGVSSNEIYYDGFYYIREKVREGESFAKALNSTRLFPSMVSQMSIVGEQSGKMETMMYKISDYYEEQVNNLVETLSSLIEPIMLVLLGVIVGGFVITMYLPIFKLGEVIAG